jgi:hypothetical protein
MKKLILLFFILAAHVSFAASATIVPESDVVTNTWTATPLWSKISEDIDSFDGILITSPLNPSAADTITFTLSNISDGQANSLNIRVRARRSIGARTVSLNISWFDKNDGLINSMDTGALSDLMSDYSSFLSAAASRSVINDSYISVIPSTTGADQSSAIEIDSVNLDLTTSNPNLTANGSFTGHMTNKTGENFVIEGSCEATGLTAAENVHILLQNSTDNVTFTTITTDSSQPVYANVSSYAIGSLMDSNSSAFRFHVNATRSGVYYFRIQCNGTNTEQTANSTGINFSAGYVLGDLNVMLEWPFPEMNTNVAQNMTFNVTANITCVNATNPTAVCGNVNGTARYNSSAENPDVQISPGEAKPFWSGENQTCGFMNHSNVCSLTWKVNATGDIGSQHKIDVLFTSNMSYQNNTPYANVTITPCIIDFTLRWADIKFGTLLPGTKGNPAPGNEGGYNITINRDSCATNLYVRGTSLINSSREIGAGNITWGNSSNIYSESCNLSGSNTLIKENVPAETNATTWYWMNVPVIYFGIYTGIITITGEEYV